MIEPVKKLIGDWKAWFAFAAVIMAVVSEIADRDFFSVILLILNFAFYCLCHMYNTTFDIYDRVVEKQDEMLEKADIIISAQTEVIKDLEKRLYGKNREDSADSGAGVVAEEALQAHEE